MEKKLRYYKPRTGESGELILIGLPEGITAEQLAAAVGAVEGEIPVNVSELINDAGYVDAAGAAAAAPVQSVNGLTGAVKVISDAGPSATATAAQCLAYAQAHPNVMFTWARWAAATYTPVQTSGSWVYTLYTTYSDSGQYAVFEAANNTTGDLYRCKADGTWVRLLDKTAIVRETFTVKTSFAAGTIGTRGAQVSINAAKSGYTLIGAWIVYIEDSSSYHPLVFRAGSPATTVYVNFYRCVSTAVSDIDVTVECLYEKN
jgi:hypothetical protein